MPPLLEARDDAVRAQRHGAHRRRIGDDGKNDLGFFRHRARGVGQAHAGLDQRLGLVARPVPAGHFMSRRHQPRHDELAHGAEPDKS